MVTNLLDSKRIAYTIKGSWAIVRCINPEHEDNNPSMHISTVSGGFKCLSCGYSGNIYKYFGIIMDSTSAKVEQIKRKIYNLTEAQALQLPIGYEEFKRSFRGISPSTFEHFGAFTHPEVVPGMDSSNRIIIPITDISGNIYTFQGRHLHSDANPKYVFYPAHSKIRPFPQEVSPGTVVIVEGLFDLFNLYDKGITNVICTFGTSFASSKEAAKQLDIYGLQGASNFVILYDSDKAGQKGARKLKEILSENYRATIYELEDGLDPGDLSKLQVQALKGELYGSSS